MSSSERQPLISGSTRAQLENSVPSKGQRIQIAQAMGALQAGKLPSQSQLSKIFQIAINSDTLKAGGGASSRTARLGEEGQRVVGDFKDVLKALKQWGDAKNGNDIIQNLFYNAATADVDADFNAPTAPSQKEMSGDAQRAIESFRSIASLIVTSPAFRQLGSDVILLSRDIFADAASVAADQAKQAAESTRPSEQERQEGVDFDKLKQKGKQTARGARSGKLQGDATESLWDEVEKVKNYMDDKLPDGEEARDKVIERLQQVVTQAQDNPEYKRSITAIVNLVKKYANKANDALDETKDKSSITDDDERVQQAGRDLKTFIEKLTNKPVDDLIKAVQKAADDVKDDERLSSFFSELDKFVDRLLYQPGYVASQKAYNRASQLYDSGQELISENDQWKNDAKELQTQLEGFANGIAHDEPTNNLVKALEELGDSLLTAGQIGLGSLQAEGKGLYRDLIDVVVPRLVGLIKEIPVPRIEYKSEDVDLVIDDVKLESASFIPDSLRFVQRNDLRFTQGYATYASEFDGTVRLRVEGLHLEASNIAFWVSKKTGFLPFEDSGLLDVQFGPQGLSFDVTLENATEEDRETFFTVKEVHTWITGFDFQLRESKASFAAWFARPVIRAFIRRTVANALESQIADYLRELDFRMYGIQQRAIAATNAKPTAANFINAIVRDSIFPRSLTGGPTRVKPTGVTKYGKQGEYVLHIGVDEELFPDQPPSSISNTRRQKLKAQAQQAQAASKRAVGSADQFKKAGQDAADKGKKEANDLDAKRKEAARRESRSEGWRSEAFDV